MPDDTTLIRWANLVQPKTLEKFNERVVQLAVERKVTNGRKLRTDGTVVEANIRPPSDSRLLADSVRVLARTIVRGQALLQSVGEKVQAGFEDGTQQAKRLAHQIGETLRSKKEAAQNAGKQAYQELLRLTEQTLSWADQIQKQVKRRSQPKIKRLAETLTRSIPLAKQVVQQTTRRVLQNEQVPCLGKDREYL